MACNALSSLNFVVPKHFLFSDSLHYAARSRLALPPPSRVASIPLPPTSADYLAGEFSGRGVAFEAIGDDCVARLSLDDGSSAVLMLPRGLVTSYKAPMWHGARMELLQTVVSEGEDGGGAEVRGGVCVDVSVEGDGEGGRVSWRPRDWAVRDVRGNSGDSVQVELISRDSEGMVDVRYVLTLREQVLSTEMEVSNSGTTTVELRGSILSHLNVSTPDATYAVGLEGSDFFRRPPFSSSFRIVPPEFDQKSKLGLGKLWEKFKPQGFASGNDYGMEDEMEGEEDDNYKRLTDEMSLIYTSAPTNLTIIDRGRRNSVVVGKDGYDELYLYSPGSQHEHYSKYAYICVGQSALLKPVVIGPGEVWIGGQHLHNPNV
ncbi:protein NDH-DEPENDENT CYCLIC ELECTRON FLOW 5 [Syzygium oleosum]|uniref:protein NDH-DEPENDENT CYCLIC ELECTRON FLOW 5 n=1 Tax=Syzygium oleosum TaxID=219896 RepID=UPI0024BADE7C|nr:protein NDH-DEPENDENT CYCLIC ELECTRON FLOW 5 [Syzygium oleosum]